jgi:DNA-binding winged helix-turn-helix (wHTH) protein
MVCAVGSSKLVTYNELTERTWGPKRIVTPENVAQHIKGLRRAPARVAIARVPATDDSL